MKKISKVNAEKLMKEGKSVKIILLGVGNEYNAKVDLLAGEKFDMEYFLFKLLRLTPGVDMLPRMEFYTTVEQVRVIYQGRWVIKHAEDNRIIGKESRIRGPKELVRYLNSHYLKVVNKGFLMPDFRKNLIF